MVIAVVAKQFQTETQFGEARGWCIGRWWFWVFFCSLYGAKANDNKTDIRK